MESWNLYRLPNSAEPNGTPARQPRTSTVFKREKVEALRAVRYSLKDEFPQEEGYVIQEYQFGTESVLFTVTSTTQAPRLHGGNNVLVMFNLVKGE